MAACEGPISAVFWTNELLCVPVSPRVSVVEAGLEIRSLVKRSISIVTRRAALPALVRRDPDLLGQLGLGTVRVPARLHVRGVRIPRYALPVVGWKLAGPDQSSRGGIQMGARQKLNNFNTLGVLAVAGLIGGLAGSWAVFFVVAAVLWVAAVSSGDIRR